MFGIVINPKPPPLTLRQAYVLYTFITYTHTFVTCIHNVTVHIRTWYRKGLLTTGLLKGRKPKCANAFEAFQTIVRTEGWAGVYRGWEYVCYSTF